MKQVTMQHLCAECNQTTTLKLEIERGNNIVDITCSHCGERWHVSVQVLSLDPLLVGDWLTKRYIGVVRDTTFFSKEQSVNKQEEVMLKDLRPGAVFVTREGIYAVKSEYFYTGDSQSQCECVLLASGEYAHFRDGNETLVREASVAGLAKSVTGPSTELLGERDTHFAGWAKLVVDKLERNWLIPGHPSVIPIIKKDMAKIITQCAYDLVYHSVDETGVAGYEGLHTVAEIVKDIPDLAEWPVEPDELTKEQE